MSFFSETPPFLDLQMFTVQQPPALTFIHQIGTSTAAESHAQMSNMFGGGAVDVTMEIRAANPVVQQHMLSRIVALITW